jgi:Protein of unknown function (DUF4232)
MRNHLRAGWLAAAAAAVAAGALAGCGSVAAPATGSGPDSVATQGALTSPAGSSSPAAVAGSGSTSATPSPSAAGGASAPAGTAVACTTADLKVVLDTAAQGVAAGTYFVPLEFTNTSRQSCQLTGYPAVALTSGQAGQQIGPAAATDHAVTASAVLVAPGGQAHAWLQMLSTANYPASQCHPATAAGMQVTAPGTQGARYVAHRVPTCQAAIAGTSLLVVHPVQAGRARRGTA